MDNRRGDLISRRERRYAVCAVSAQPAPSLAILPSRGRGKWSPGSSSCRRSSNQATRKTAALGRFYRLLVEGHAPRELHHWKITNSSSPKRLSRRVAAAGHGGQSNNVSFRCREHFSPPKSKLPNAQSLRRKFERK